MAEAKGGGGGRLQAHAHRSETICFANRSSSTSCSRHDATPRHLDARGELANWTRRVCAKSLRAHKLKCLSCVCTRVACLQVCLHARMPHALCDRAHGKLFSCSCLGVKESRSQTVNQPPAPARLGRHCPPSRVIYRRHGPRVLCGYVHGA